jgi:glycosyltransferase involved in cell wall biosynthesis
MRSRSFDFAQDTPLDSAQDRPRVLAVTGAYAPELSSGGLQSRAVARALQGRAIFHVLTTATNASLPVHDVVDAVPVTRIFMKARSRMSQWRALGRFFRHLRTQLPAVSVVHVQGVSAKNIIIAAMSKTFRRPLIVHLQTSLHDEPPAIRSQGVLAWWAFRSADAYISVSRNLTTAFLEAGLPADRIREVPNGVDTTRFHPATADDRRQLREQLGLPPDLPILLFVGVVAPDKQPHVLIKAWAALQEAADTRCAVVFIGATDPSLFELDGRAIDDLRAEAVKSRAAERVFFIPPTPLIEDYYRAADVLVMPSAREGMPNVLLEAMACGLAVVASRLPGSTTTLIDDDGNGLLCPVGDVAAFTAAIGRVLQDGALGARLGTAARATIEDRYRIELVAEQWLAVYRELASQ